MSGPKQDWDLGIKDLKLSNITLVGK